MFSANYFTYDGVFSGTYGLMLADFNEDVVTETTAFSPQVNIVRPAKSHRAFLAGVNYPETPSHTFSMVSQMPIPDTVRREIISWLVGRSDFKKLEIHQSDLEGYYYRCIFSNLDIIYINGLCHGFRVTAMFDSPYQYGTPTIYEADLNYSGNGMASVPINCNSDIKDGYIYPIVEFTANDTFRYAGEDLGIYIANRNVGGIGGRPFKFTNDICGKDATTVDNELKMINGGSIDKDRFRAFNKKWLRLAPGRVNYLNVALNGSIKIICPQYVMIGF